MILRYNCKQKVIMDWKSTALVNATTIGLSMTHISEAVKIGAMIVGMVWTFVQITNGVNQFRDRRDRLNRIRKEKQRRKDKRND
jgi:hypothetical protein